MRAERVFDDSDLTPVEAGGHLKSSRKEKVSTRADHPKSRKIFFFAEKNIREKNLRENVPFRKDVFFLLQHG
jgi:hypothetical protein